MFTLPRRRLFAVALTVILAAATLATLPSTATSALHFPIAITGSATINGAPAPANSVITVAVNGATCPTNPAIVRPDSAGNWALVLEFKGPCPEPGITTFYINGRFAGGPFATTPRGPVHLTLPYGTRVTVPQLSRD